MRRTDVIIVGAGAAGMMCALTAARRGRRVLLVDHANKAGKKILMSGGGRCNFTNLWTEPTNFSSQNPHFAKSALARYSPWDFIAMVEHHGVAYHEKKLGQLFCDGRSHQIRDMLLDECRRAGVEIQLDTGVRQIARTQDGYALESDLGPLSSQSLVIATGGLSIPTMGASGFGYDVARQFGHEVVDPRAGLVPLIVTEEITAFCAELAGTSLDASVSCNGQSFRESILFTHRGLSGPAILQISSFWQLGDTVSIDLLPDRDALQWLNACQAEHPDRELRTILGEVFTRKLAALISDAWFTSGPMKRYTPAELAQTAARLAHWPVVPAGTEGYRTAEVTIGGVATAELSSQTMESRRSPGLYFIGEVLDVTGQLGGFNFQWVWASGSAAGQYV